MLTPMLKQVKEKLDKKGYIQRTTTEDKLLKELEEIDKSKDLSEGFTKLGKSFSFTGGEVDKCPCCGR